MINDKNKEVKGLKLNIFINPVNIDSNNTAIAQIRKLQSRYPIAATDVQNNWFFNFWKPLKSLWAIF
jgi:hypothetical protein